VPLLKTFQALFSGVIASFDRDWACVQSMRVEGSKMPGLQKLVFEIQKTSLLEDGFLT
jgi:hypothetical protein